MQRLHAQLMGRPEVLVGGRPMVVDTRKAVALLALLAVEGAVTRDRAAELLWTGTDQSRARAALRRTLSVLRKGLDGQGLEVGAEHLGLVAEAVTSDVARLLEPAPPLGLLLETAESDFLDGLHLRGAEGFDAWRDEVGELLRRRRLQGFDRHLEQLLGTRPQPLDDLEVVARARLAVDPFSERTRALLIWLAGRRGDRDLAAREYQACVATLRDELGVAPLAATVEVYEAALAGRSVEWLGAQEAPVSRPSLPTSSPSLPFVGRDGLLTSLADAAGDAGRFVVVVGPSGFGRTRLLRELTAVLRDRGRKLAVTSCHADESALPWAPTIDLLHQLDPAPSRAVATVAPELAPGEEGFDVADRDRQAALVAGLWEAVAGTDTVVLVDDLDRADAATRGLLAHGSRRPSRATVIATARPGFALGAMPSGSGVEVVELPALDAAAVAALADHAGAADPQRLLHESGGSPLLLASLLRPDAGGATRGILDALSPVQRGVLEVLALSRRGLPLTLVAVAVGEDVAEVRRCVDDLVGLGVSCVGDAARLGSDVVRAAVVGRLGPERTAVLHRRIAAALGPAPADAALRAHHLRAGGDTAGAATAHAEAADHATAAGAWEEASHHLQRALALGNPAVAALREQLADLDARRGRLREAADGYSRLLADGLAEEAEARVAHHLGRLHLTAAQWEAARVHLVRARRGAGPARRRGIDVDLARAEWELGDRAGALQRLAETLDEALADGDVEAAGLAANGLGRAHRRDGDLEQATTVLERGRAIAPSSGPIGMALANGLGLALAARGFLDEARAVLVQARSLAVEQGDLLREAAILNNLADLEHRAGDVAARDGHQREAMARFALVDDGRDPGPWMLMDW